MTETTGFSRPTVTIVAEIDTECTINARAATISQYMGSRKWLHRFDVYHMCVDLSTMLRLYSSVSESKHMTCTVSYGMHVCIETCLRVCIRLSLCSTLQCPRIRLITQRICVCMCMCVGTHSFLFCLLYCCNYSSKSAAIQFPSRFHFPVNFNPLLLLPDRRYLHNIHT